MSTARAPATAKAQVKVVPERRGPNRPFAGTPPLAPKAPVKHEVPAAPSRAVANGNEIGGMYADSHSGAPPEPVWELLDDLVGRAPNLRGITFEMHDSYLPVLGFDGIAEVIARARRAWGTRH